MKNKYNKKILLIIFTSMLILFASCGGRNETPPEPEPALPIDIMIEPTPEVEMLPVLTQYELYYLLNNEGLPRWLHTGLSLYWKDNEGEPLPDINRTIDVVAWQTEARQRELPVFGDGWFIPYFIRDELLESADCVALSFVRFIHASRALDTLIEAYNTQRKLGNGLFIDLWANFTGMDFPTGIIIWYEGGKEIEHGRDIFVIYVSVHGYYSHYYFGTEPGGRVRWTYDFVSHAVAIGEESIPFIMDWLDVELDTPVMRTLNIITAAFMPGAGGWYAAGTNTIVNTLNLPDPPLVMAHEAAHAILNAAGMSQADTNFPLISRVQWPDLFPGEYTIMPHYEEGLCILLELLFELATENERYAVEAARMRISRNRTTRMRFDEVINYVNMRAIRELGERLYRRYGEPFPELQFNETTASFMFYLYTERGTRADLLTVYQDIYRMYDIFGTDINGMITSWLAWLEDWR